MNAPIFTPAFLYGTAWKEDHTRRLVELALEQGFRAIDTANQRRHYVEAAVGEAVKSAIERGRVRREELFLQTKFTFRGGQDHRLPYDPSAPIATQVAQSFASSLDHLGVATIDSYLLHGPSQRQGLSADDWEAWRAIEGIHDSGRARAIGVSNVNLAQLEELVAKARIRPHFVQNRCYASAVWDQRVRRYCTANEIVYQGFSLLTANREIFAHPAMLDIARRHCRTVSQIVFRFCLDVGMLPLTGTSDARHMQEDLAILDFQLDPTEIGRIEQLVAV